MRENEGRGQGQLMRALRRSWLTLLVCAVAGVVVMAIVHETRATQYQAVSEVYIAEQDLNALVLGVPITSDPQRDIANDLSLASSINFNQAVAQRLGRRGFGYRDVESNLSVTNDGTNDILTFTATGNTAQQAVTLANTAVTAYDAYRAQILSQPILSSLASGGHTVTDAQRLELLARLNQNAVVISRAQNATQQASLSKDLAIGLIVGLVVGLLIMAVREAVPVLSPDPDVALLRRPGAAGRRRSPSGGPVPGPTEPPEGDPGRFEDDLELPTGESGSEPDDSGSPAHADTRRSR